MVKLLTVGNAYKSFIRITLQTTTQRLLDTFGTQRSHVQIVSPRLGFNPRNTSVCGVCLILILVIVIAG
jgi:hypothetical protein